MIVVDVEASEEVVVDLEVIEVAVAALVAVVVVVEVAVEVLEAVAVEVKNSHQKKSNVIILNVELIVTNPSFCLVLQWLVNSKSQQVPNTCSNQSSMLKNSFHCVTQMYILKTRILSVN